MRFTTEALFIPLVSLLAGCGADHGFRPQYDHYFPARPESLESNYRKSYDEWVFEKEPTKSGSERHWQLYHAVRGDEAATRLFFNNPDREVAGEPAEGWNRDCLLLLIVLGDERFSTLLRQEKPETRAAVGYALDPQVHWEKTNFPKTRSLYAYRFSRKE